MIATSFTKFFARIKLEKVPQPFGLALAGCLVGDVEYRDTDLCCLRSLQFLHIDAILLSVFQACNTSVTYHSLRVSLQFFYSTYTYST